MVEHGKGMKMGRDGKEKEERVGSKRKSTKWKNGIRKKGIVVETKRMKEWEKG